jgi:hypothetical protein
MITDKEFCEACHLQIHAIRLLTNYKSSEFERKISRLVIEKFSPTCRECKEIGEKLKANPPQQKQSMLKKLGEVLDKN